MKNKEKVLKKSKKKSQKNMAQLKQKIGEKLKRKKSREKTSRLSRGGRNLLILVGGAILIALTVTSVSLYIYHASGDIYLDRSRPGFLPEESEETEEQEETYKMSETGEINGEVLEEYLEKIEEPVETIDEMGDTFGETPLSDEALGVGTEN